MGIANLKKNHLLGTLWTRAVLIALFFAASGWNAASAADTFDIVQQQQPVKGKVLDEEGLPLPGATIMIVGSTTGTSTDIDGNFSIEAKTGDVLEVSFVGYIKKLVPVAPGANYTVTLLPDVKNLEEVVVIGYGSVKKSDLTGAVSSLKADDINIGANVSVDQMMLGRAAGVQISQSSSEPGGGLSIRVRGASSINASNEPLYVIDGFPIDNSSNLSASSMIGQTDADATQTANVAINLSPRNPLNSLNPNDIESIEILKDASATAIYGSRGANGVVLITTRKGKKDKISVGYSSYFGAQDIARKVDVLAIKDYTSILNAIAKEQGEAELFSAADIASYGDGVDWQKEVYRTAPLQDHNFSVSGGMGKSNIFASLNYFGQEGIVKNTGINKYIGRLNFDSQISDRIQLGFNMNSSLITDRNGVDGVNTNESAGPIYASLLYAPNEKIYEADGTLAESDFLTINNPVSLIQGVKNTSETNRTMANFNLTYEMFKNFKMKLNLGSDRQNMRRNVYNSTLTRRGGPLGGQADITSLDRSSYLMEYTLDYNKEFNENNRLSVFGGVTYQKFNLFLFSGNISGFPTDALETNNLGLGDTNTDNLMSRREDNTLLSYLGRVNYTLFNKILLTGSIRADGSSRFGSDNKFGYFPSFALGYKLSEEDFIPEFFKELKLRASWGQTGNQEIANYASQLTFGTGPAVVLNGVTLTTVQPERIPNPGLKWETTTQFNVGLDASILEGRISATVDYFRKYTTDLLFNLPLPSASGYASILTNVGAVSNQGFELLVNSVNISSNDFSWNTALNFSAIRNQVEDLGRIAQIVTGNIQAVGNTSIIRVGEPLAAYYGYVVDGIQQAGSPKPGQPNFVDLNKDGLISPLDQTVIGDPFPDFTFGINNAFKYKNLGLTFFIQGMQGGELLSINVIESMYPSNFRRNRLSEMALDRWTASNTDARWPSFANTNAYPGGKVNSLVLQDASYIRLKNVQLSYDLPVRSIKYLSGLKLYVAAQNLFTLTDYIGFDPEANSFGRSNVKVDYSSYPLARTVTFGLNAKF
jgi:TonB-linked SusC/RagA family outer membrane protein